MKVFLNCRMLLACFLVWVPLGALADTFFTDNFSSGSTTNGLSIPGGPPTASYTSYDFASSKDSTATTIGPGLLSCKLTGSTSSGYWEAQALFTTTPITLVSAGDYVDLTIVFTNSAGTLMTGSSSPLWIGLYNSGAAAGATNPPVAGALADAGLNTTTGSPYATGNCQLWQGYVGQLYSGKGSSIVTRPVQDPSQGTSSANQELLGSGASSGTYGKSGSGGPGATSLAQSATQTATLDTNSAYTMDLQIWLNPTNSDELIISNTLYSGVGTANPLITNSVNTSTVLTEAFDGLAFGAFNHNGSYNPQMDVSSISVTGHSTEITNAPAITNQPVSISAALGSTVPFTVGASGFNMTYQWHRNGTNLVNGGNISGANSSTLVISPVTAADVSSSYYVTVTGAGNYSTNSTMASLSLRTANNLVWNGSGGTAPWDLNTTANWLNGGSAATFNYGDAVTFNDTGVQNAPIVNLSNPFLSASSVTVNTSSQGYTFSGSGSFAGSGSLNYIGSGGLEIDNANTYSGGTIISNASAYLYLNNLNGLGTGPITLTKAGGFMEVVPNGGSSYGLQGDIVVADDFTIQFDGYGSYAGVIFGNLSGTAGKTLTFQPGNLTATTTNRYRVYGADTVYDANLVLDGPAVANANYSGTALAPYNGSGTQTYNGVISGNGGLVQRGGGTTILNGANTYSGGTTPTTGSIGFGVDSVGNPVTAGPIGTGPLYLAPEVPDATGSGTILAYGTAHTIANPVEYPSATNNLTLIIGGTNDLTLAGPLTLNGDDNTGTQTNRTIEVDNTALTTISGVISDNGMGFSLTKTGSGTLALDNAETYSGTTTVASGLLGGTGTIAGPVIATGGGIAPGDNGIGTLTIDNSLTLQSGSTNVFEVNATAGTHDLVSVSGAVTYGGTLYATNLSDTLTTNDSFTIFNAGSESGNFTTIAGSPGLGLAWSFNPTTGVLGVVTGVATNPTNITVSISSGNLNLSWPADHLGWALQTNSVGLAATNMWFAYPGSTSVTNVAIPISTAETNVFYRLIYNP
jgi:fibronectin-binding autotransporter adhesin